MFQIGKVAIAGALGLTTLVGGYVAQDQAPATSPAPTSVTTPSSGARTLPGEELPGPRGGPLNVSGFPIQAPGDDRLRVLEEKLDRVLNALERSTRAPARNVPAADPLLPSFSRATAPGRDPFERSAPTAPRATTTAPARAPTPAPIAMPADQSVKQRLDTLEHRLDELERAFKALNDRAARDGSAVDGRAIYGSAPTVVPSR